jgi:hypothetical protein
MRFGLTRFILLFSLFTALNAQAYITGQIGDSKIDKKNRTHIVVAGIGKELGTLFQAAAIAKGLKIQAVHPNDQIFYISVSEPEHGDNVYQLQRRGLKNVKSTKDDFTEEFLFNELSQFTQIASISFFGHSAAHVGLLLQNKYDRMNYTSPQLKRLKGHFTEDSYVQFYSCNAGFFLAPKIARIWGVPTSGALTSTDFEQLHVDGQWYFNTTGRYPTGGWADANSSTLNKQLSCKSGLCVRLRPDNYPYNGFWGQYKNGGLSFFKFFCPKNDKSRCAKAMALSMLTQFSGEYLDSKSSMRDFLRTSSEFLCPNNSTGDLRKSCMSSLEMALATGNETYNPYRKQTLQCDHKGCYFGMTCKAPTLLPFPSECVIDNPVEGPTTTLVRELKMYIEGFELIKKEQGLAFDKIEIAPVNNNTKLPVDSVKEDQEGSSRVDAGWN